MLSISYHPYSASQPIAGNRTFKDCAFEFYRLSYWPIPLVPGEKFPPRGVRYRRYSYEDLGLDQLVQWVQDYPDHATGLLTGRSKLFVLDIDKKNGGLDRLGDLEQLGVSFEGSLVVDTPSGGLHVYYQMAEGQCLKSTQQGEIFPGVDTRGIPGLAKCPPSPGYCFRSPLPPLEQLPLVPDLIADRVRKDDRPSRPRPVSARSPSRPPFPDEGTEVDATRSEFIAYFGRLHLDVRPGQGNYRCPLHQDKSPSLSINADLLQFQCHSCGVKGGLDALRRLVEECTGDVGISPIHTPTTGGQILTPFRCPHEKTLFMQYRPSNHARFRTLACGEWDCEVCGPLLRSQMSLWYRGRFLDVSKNLYRREVGGSEWPALYQRIFRAPSSYLRVPRENGRFVVFTNLELSSDDLLNDELGSIREALDSCPRGTGYITSSADVRFRKREPNPDLYVTKVNKTRVKERLTANGLMTPEQPSLPDLEMPLRCAPEWMFQAAKYGIKGHTVDTIPVGRRLTRNKHDSRMAG